MVVVLVLVVLVVLVVMLVAVCVAVWEGSETGVRGAAAALQAAQGTSSAGC